MRGVVRDEGSDERGEGNGRGGGKREEKGREREGRGEGKEGGKGEGGEGEEEGKDRRRIGREKWKRKLQHHRPTTVTHQYTQAQPPPIFLSLQQHPV